MSQQNLSRNKKKKKKDISLTKMSKADEPVSQKCRDTEDDAHTLEIG